MSVSTATSAGGAGRRLTKPSSVMSSRLNSFRATLGTCTHPTSHVTTVVSRDKMPTSDVQCSWRLLYQFDFAIHHLSDNPGNSCQNGCVCGCVSPKALQTSIDITLDSVERGSITASIVSCRFGTGSKSVQRADGPTVRRRRGKLQAAAREGSGDRQGRTSQLCDDGCRSSSFLPVKMSIATKWHLACPCLPVFDVETSTTCISIV